MAEFNFLTVSLTRKDIERVFAKVIIDSNDPLGKCWIWNGALNTYGYGEVWYKNRQEVTHRFMYAWLIEPIPQGVAPDIPNLDHFICDNPACCNPFHLRLVLPRENLFRGNSVSSINKRKTHCKRGHLLPTEPNRKDCLGRYCPICRKQTLAEYYQNVGKSRQRERRGYKA